MAGAAMAVAVAILAAGDGSAAAPVREFCPSRPGLDVGACTVEPGHFQVETGLGDFIHDRDGDGTTDTLLVADTLLRIGLDETSEAQIEWTPFGRVRMRDAATGRVDRAARVGDVRLGLRRNLRHPDGKGTALAVQPFVVLPVGRAPVGAGDWGAGVIVPLSFDLADAISLTLDPEADAAVDADGDGRHLAYGGVVSVGLKLADDLDATVEYAAMRDRDPAGHETERRAAVALAWARGANMAFDVGAIVGLDRATPDLEVYVGVSRRF